MSTSVAKSSVGARLWNPWLDAVAAEDQLEQALDLTVTKEEQQPAPRQPSQFDYQQFYAAYSLIAEREGKLVGWDCEGGLVMERWPGGELQGGCGNPTLETHIKQEKNTSKNKENLRGVKKLKPTTAKSAKRSTKSKSRTLNKIASIKQSCDCRFCYEDHIMRMRLKVSKPFLC